jgi:DNA-binding NarL/FixJ family response regulator
VSELRVVIADDDDAVRSAMAEVLNAHDGLTVVAELARGGVELAQAVARTEAQVVILDIRMPEGGVPAALALGRLSPPPVVVVASASTDARTVTAMLEAGVSGFLAKGRLGGTFADDVIRCARGDVIIAVSDAAEIMRALVARRDLASTAPA